MPKVFKFYNGLKVNKIKKIKQQEKKKIVKKIFLEFISFELYN